MVSSNICVIYRKLILIITLLLSLTLIIACGPESEDSFDEQHSEELETEEAEGDEEDQAATDEPEAENGEDDALDEKEEIFSRFEGEIPTLWGENLPGVVTHIDTSEKVIALTFDACGGIPGEAYDEALIDFLSREEIPATLFFAGKWIKNHPEIFKNLAEDPLFEVANHGYNHKPLSVSGEKAYGIQGTKTLEEAFDEIMKNQELIESITGNAPSYFRSGTAYYDDVTIKILKKLGLTPVNYNVLGDAGATFTKEQIANSMDTAGSGSIILFHMNHPDKPIMEGVKEGVQRLREKGFSFVTIGEYDDQLR